MKIVLYHNYKETPDYFYDCIKQLELFGNTDGLTIISNKITEAHCEHVLLSDLADNRDVHRFNKACFLGDFWKQAMERLFYISSYMDKSGEKDIFHLENDNLVYFDIKSKLNTFKDFSKGLMCIPRLNNCHYALSFVYIPNHNSIHDVCNLLIHYLEHGESNVKGLMRKDIGIDFINEMTLLSLIRKRHGLVFIDLPTHPKESETFNGIFDAARYGQYLTGTQTDGPGWMSDDSEIGKEILSKNINPVWFNYQDIPFFSDLNCKVPFVSWEKGPNIILNLHVHSKRLKEFMYDKE